MRITSCETVAKTTVSSVSQVRRRLWLCGLVFLAFIACRTVSKADIPRLIKQLRASQSSERNQAAMELASLGPDADSAVPALTQALSDSNGGVRSSVAFALRKIDTPEARRALDNYKR